MTQEVSGLRVDAIDALSSAIEQRTGLITGYLSHGDGVCALGTLGCDASGVYDLTHTIIKVAIAKFGWTYGLGAFAKIASANNGYEGTPAGRKEFMLDWLQKQRDFKCSDWTPPPIERVPERKAKSKVDVTA